MKLALLLAACGDSAGTSFDTYCADFGKNYTNPTEYAKRQEIFDAAVAQVEAHNAGDDTFKLGINHLSDYTKEEQKALRGFNKFAHRRSLAASNSAPVGYSGAALADSIDWVAKGATTPVKNQGGCGSCWAFSGTEAIESNVFLNTGKKLILAPQEFVDCAPDTRECGGTGGCEGSTPQLLFDYASQAGAVEESKYAYTARDGKCKMGSLTPSANITGYKNVESNNYQALMEAVNKQPISIGVAAQSWGMYSSGVLSFAKCDADIDHAVLLVGYGTDSALGDYWKVQNSWGAGWGEHGFIRLARSANDDSNCKTDANTGDGFGCKGDPKTAKVCGTCGILYANAYPVGGKLI